MIYNRAIKTKEGEVLDNEQFQALFETLLGASVKTDAVEGIAINPERYEVLKRVFDEVSALVGNGESAKLKLHPAFASGSVSAKVQSAELNGEKLSRLKEVLSDCATFAVDPLTDGTVSISVTVQKVFERN